MDDFEEKLNSILASPETMGQIMALADSITGQSGQPSEKNSSSSLPAAAPAAGSGNPLALLQNLDPSVLSTVGTLFQEYNRSDDEKTALLHALQPFLREERRSKIEKAIQITRLSRVIRAAFQLFREKGHV